LQHNNTFPQTIGSEEIQSLIAQSKTRVLESFEKGSGLNTKVKDPSDIFLSKYIGTTLKLVVLYVDLVGSTLMTRSLPVNRLATVIQAWRTGIEICR
jgi:adenylate cyclase